MFRADRDEKESRVAYWLGAIRSHAPNAPIIIVATHLDKYVDPKGAKKIKPSLVGEALTGPIMEKYRAKYPKLERTVRAVSTLTFKGIDELIRTIHEVALKQSYAQEPPPDKWFDLEGIFLDTRRRLNTDSVVPILSWDDTANVSKIAQFPTNDNQAELIKAVDFLHETGTIFRHIYTDEKTGITKRTIILDPQWVARVFSTVITTKHGFLKNGNLEERMLFEQLWREFPKPTHTLLLDLFQQFDLIYKVSDEKGNPTGELLIPATLPTPKPSDVQSLLPTKETSLYQFERRYTFDFMPVGLFSRYLVRAMSIANPVRYWRHGCLVRHGTSNTFAMIEMKPQAHIMTIVVRSDTDATQFFCKVTELFEFLVNHFFRCDYIPQYIDPITATQFSLEQIEEATAKGETSVASKDGTMIAVDRIAPDLALTTFAALQIDIEKEVELLPTPLGEGAFAVVLEGKYTNEKVAVKRLLRCSTEEQQRRLFSEFRREVLTMSQLAHPNIVNLKGFSNKPPFSMVMELVPHGTLYDFLRKPDPIPWPTRIRIAYDIAAAMHFLHSADPPLIHKDLKSPNILLAGTKHDDLIVAKVADFGISGKLYSDKFKAITAKEREVENPTWLAPEVIKAQPYTAAADVYPYGIMLWELAARSHPFEEFHYSFATDIEDAVVSGKRPTIPKDCPRAFEALIQDCWHDNPAQRPTFAQIMARFPSIVSEVAPTMSGLLMRLRRDLSEFNKQQEAVSKARNLARQEKWKKMREEESAREAERRRQAALALSVETPSSSTIDDDDIGTSTEDSTDMSESKDSTKQGSSLNTPTSEDIRGSAPLSSKDLSSSDEPVHSLRRTHAAKSSLGSLDISTVYQRLTEAELKDLWIQRGIPLQEGHTRERLAEVLENDDHWLFNQRRILLSAPSSTSSHIGAKVGGGQAGTLRASVVSSSNLVVPPQVSLPCLYVISSHLIPSEIQERNELIAKQEKALGELLKQHESARLELHLKHQKAIDSRAQKAPLQAKSPPPSSSSSSATATASTASSSSSAVTAATASSGLTSSSVSAPNSTTGSDKPSIAALMSTYGQHGQQHSSSSTSTAKPTAASNSTSHSKTSSAPSTTASPTAVAAKASASTSASAASTSNSTPAKSAAAPLNASNRTNPPPPRPLSESTSGKSTAATTSSSSSGIVASSCNGTVSSASTSSSSSSTSSTTSTAAKTQANGATRNAAGDLVIKGKWNVSERTAGGSPNTPHWRRNPQFTILVGPGGGTAKLTLSQLPKDPLPFLAFYIFKAGDDKRVLDMKEKIYAPDHFINKESIDTTCKFPEGIFSIMCATFQPETGDFTLTVSGSCVQSLQPTSEYLMTETKGEWVKPNAGGCMNHPTWRSNPRYSLKVLETTGKTKIIGVLVAHSEVGAGFYVFSSSNQNVPVTKSGFTTVSVCHEFSLAAGDYTLIPATYEFGKETPFEITIYSDKPVQIAPIK